MKRLNADRSTANIGKQGGARPPTEEDGRAIQETTHLLSIRGMRKSILEGLDTPLEECNEELEW